MSNWPRYFQGFQIDQVERPTDLALVSRRVSSFNKWNCSRLEAIIGLSEKTPPPPFSTLNPKPNVNTPKGPKGQ